MRRLQNTIAVVLLLLVTGTVVVLATGPMEHRQQDLQRHRRQNLP